MKLYRPDLQITMIDSLGKRIRFLESVATELGLTGVEAIHGRGEDMGKEAAYREKFDLATARAVRGLRELSEYCLPYVKVGGMMLAMKSTGSREEIDGAGRAVSILGGRMLPSFDYTIPGTDITHRVVRIEKIASTAQKYPRRFSQIKKSPL